MFRFPRRLTIALTLLIAAVLLLTLFLTVDAEAPDDAHMEVPSVRVAPADNGFLIYEKAVAVLVTGAGGRIDPVTMASTPEPDDPGFERVEKNSAALKLFDDAMARPRFVPPPCVDPGDYVPSLFEASNITHLVQWRIRRLRRLGETRRALEDCLRLIRFGRTLQSDNAVLITAMIAHIPKRLGLEELLLMIEAGELDASLAKRGGEVLATLRTTDSVIEDIIRREYACSARVVDIVDEQPFYHRDLAGLGSAASIVFFKPNATRGAFLRRYELALAEVAHPLVERRSANAARRLAERGRWRKYLSGNAFGEELVELCVPSFDHFDDMMFLERKTETCLALVRFIDDHGELPERLDELVPAYLATVPTDLYDGGPLSYERDGAAPVIGRSAGYLARE